MHKRANRIFPEVPFVRRKTYGVCSLSVSERSDVESLGELLSRWLREHNAPAVELARKLAAISGKPETTEQSQVSRYRNGGSAHISRATEIAEATGYERSVVEAAINESDRRKNPPGRVVELEGVVRPSRPAATDAEWARVRRLSAELAEALRKLDEIEGR